MMSAKRQRPVPSPPQPTVSRLASAARGLRSECLFTARRILIDHRTLMEKGALRVRRGVITAVGPRRDFATNPGCPETDLGDVVLIPGLVNAHIHLDYSICQGRVPPGPFTRWIERMPALRRSLAPGDALAGIRRALGEIARSGTTAVGDVASIDLSPVALEESGLRYVCFYEVIHSGLPPYDEILAHVEKRLTTTAPGPRARIGLSPHAPYTVALPLMTLLRKRFHSADGLPFAIHAAESRSEIRCLRENRGALARWLRKAGFYPPLPRRPPIARSVGQFLCAGRDTNHPPDLLVHGNFLSFADLVALARRQSAALVVCPGTREYHGVSEPVVPRAARAGLPVALGTDSLASNDRLDLWAEMRRFLSTSSGLTAADAFRAATAGGARALNLEAEIGVLRTGYRADFVSIALNARTRQLPVDRLLQTWILGSAPPPICEVWVDAEPILRRPLFRER